MDLTWTDVGHGHSYLLLHGGGGPMTMAGFAAQLAGHGRVVTPTHPGFAGTDRPATMTSPTDLATAYVELLEVLDLAAVCVVGNSLGGWVAAEIALLGSPRVSAVVLLDAVGADVPGHPVPDFFALSPPEVARRSWFDPSRSVNPATLPPAVQATQPGNRIALAVYGGTMTDPTLLGRLAAVAVPTLVVWGEADRIVDLAHGRAYATAIPGARFEVIPGAGHLPQLETPDELLARVRRFAEDPSRPAPTRSVRHHQEETAMWQIEYTADTDLPPAAVWAALRDLQTGMIPLSSGDRRQLNGPFAVDSTIAVHPVGLDPLGSTITELVEPLVLAERTRFNGLTLLLRHTLSPAGTSTRITRRLEITGPTADQEGPVAGPRISQDYPDALAEIITTAHGRP